MIVNYKLFMIRWFLALAVFWVAIFFMLLGQGFFALFVLIAGGICVYYFKDSKPQLRHNAHFARPDELTTLTKDVFEGDGVLIGFAYKKPLVVRPGTAGKKELGHFMWVGPSRSGKGLSIASNLYNWEGSAIIVDIKGELAQMTAGYRQDVLGQNVFIINPSSGENSHQYDPFKELETDEQIFSAAIAFMDPESDGANAIFAQRASSALAAIIKGAKVQAAPVIPYLDSMLSHPDGLKGTALSLHKLQDPQITKWMNNFLGKNPDKIDWDEAAGDRFMNNSWQRLVTQASYLLTSGVKHMTGGSDFVAADLMDKPTTVYLVFRESELALNLGLFNLVIDAIFGAIMRRYDLDPEHHSKNSQKILAVFDEAFQAKPTKLAFYSSTVAGRGIYMCIYVQSLAQISDNWGKEGRTALMENVHTKIFLPAVDRSNEDKEGTSSFVSASCGRYMIEDRGLAKEEHGHELNTNVRMTERELIPASDFAMLGVGKSIIFCNDLPPILAYRLEPWRFKEHEQAKKFPAPVPKARPAHAPLITVEAANKKETALPTTPEPEKVLEAQGQNTPMQQAVISAALLNLEAQKVSVQSAPKPAEASQRAAVPAAPSNLLNLETSAVPEAATAQPLNLTKPPVAPVAIHDVAAPTHTPKTATLELQPEEDEDEDISAGVF